MTWVNMEDLIAIDDVELFTGQPGRRRWHVSAGLIWDRRALT
jgi:hypothetical protein